MHPAHAAVLGSATSPAARAALAPTELSAETLGSRVPRQAATGEIEAVFERACIVALSAGGAITLLAQRCGNHPHGVRLSCSPRLDRIVRVGMPVRVSRDRIGIDHAAIDHGAIVVLLEGARTWTPALQPGMFAGDAQAIDSLLTAERLLRQRAAGTHSEFLAAALGVETARTPLASRIYEFLPRLFEAWRAAHTRDTLAAIARVIGLGPGLTPAGDDFVIGWLAGMALSARSEPQARFLHAVCADLAGLRAATTPVSWQHLDDARLLQFSERLSDLGVAIARCTPTAALSACIEAQLAVGAGLIAALRA